MSRTGLPGAELVERGRRDLERGIESVESLLVSMAAERLRTLGVAVPTAFPDPQLRLYQTLSSEFGDAAHSRYNSLVRRLVSYQRALACAK